MPFEIDNYVYDSELIIAYCNIFKPKMIKISMESSLVFDNLEKKRMVQRKCKKWNKCC